MPIREFPKPISRRQILKGFGAGMAGLVSASVGGGLYWNGRPRRPTGEIRGPSHQMGHLLRDRPDYVISETQSLDTAIVGGGVAGLSAAWWLKRNNFHDFTLFELDEVTGGNSRSGENSQSAFPWGAHYLPIANRESHELIELLTEMNVIQGFTPEGLPLYDEYSLCASPQERLYYQGRWQEGLIPQYGLEALEARHYEAFFSYIEQLKNAVGPDGRPLFAIPMERSSSDPRTRALDQISMQAFMEKNGWSSKALNWYVDYCCRDDYGQGADRVSAWAGLHYFAARHAIAGNADSGTVLTWPEGNGKLVAYLTKFCQDHILSDHLVARLWGRQTADEPLRLDVFDGHRQKWIRYEAKHVIFCGPEFVAKRVIHGYQEESLSPLQYAPWMVANLTLKGNLEGRGQDLCWDNVNFYSRSLGYINAQHQDLKREHPERVITYYHPLDHLEAPAARQEARQKNHADWCEFILKDLETIHPEIRNQVSNIDVWLWGHGMCSPGIAYLWSRERQERLQPFRHIDFAHSDLSGISIFEEAQFRGVEAARRRLSQTSTKVAEVQ